ncbi:ATP-dependent RNA helicase Atu4171 [hydrothermal vent metagenome]|uniref:ATP-dependent RNA helicase Atu4171 n=1 Tax=hydrothermal vent metagenome TaxID=652676 RepID=A0A3B0SW34_9ZZZZ
MPPPGQTRHALDNLRLPAKQKKPLVKQALADALEHRGYSTLTPVQEAVTDPKLGSADLLVSAQTGSGKTVGFGLAIAQTLLGEDETFARADTPLALVIAPTRELAMQVKRELAWLYGKTGAVVVSCVGGMDMRDERRALARGAHIVVATPGRLRDHIMRGSLVMGDLRAVVLDEADEMLDLGFRDDLEFILGEAPEQRRTLMFSATVPRSIANLAKNYQNDAIRIITTSENDQHADITYRALNVSPHDGENAIINVLRYYEAPNALVFCNTRAMVNRLTTRFSNRGFSVVALSGELTQNERTHALQAMRDGRARVCVATDVAARGIDLPNLALVIHADLPSNSETLLHRSGRTGRAGRKGISALIVPPKMRRKAESLLRGAKVSAEWDEAPSAEAVHQKDQERLLTHPTWQQDISEAESTSAAKLTKLYSPEQIAVAYLRLHSERQSAPEELSTVKEGGKPKPRAAFGPSVWFSIAGGHSKNAEPRRLLPMLCKAGNITKEDIGAIRIQQDQSYVEIRKASVGKFLAGIGNSLKVEGDGITQLDTPPAISGAPKPSFAARQRPGTDAGKPGKKPHRGKAPQDTKPIDWNDAPEPRHKKPKGGAKRKPSARATEPTDIRRDGAVEPMQSKRKFSGKPGGKHAAKSGGSKAPPTGKPSSKKNRARAKAAALAKAKSGKGRNKKGAAG